MNIVYDHDIVSLPCTRQDNGVVCQSHASIVQQLFCAYTVYVSRLVPHSLFDLGCESFEQEHHMTGKSDFL